MLNNFHFLRPWWFLALIPAIIIYFYYQKRSLKTNNNWAEYCDPHLLPHLISDYREEKSSWLPHLLLSTWILTVVALCGPTWSQYADNIYQKNIARIIALDVSPSMNSADIPPSRLERAKYKVLDLLKQLKEGQTGLVVFSGSPFVVSPLTNDTNTIASMVPVLDSSIVPVDGSDIAKALKKSAQLLSQSGFSRGQIILVTDSRPTPEDEAEAAKLAANGYTTSVLAIGTAQGGPVSNASGGFATDKNGNVVFSKLDSHELELLANKGNGNYITFTNDDSDVNTILNSINNNVLEDGKPTAQMETKSLWKDEGHWLIWLLLILVIIIARKGWLEKIS